MSERVRVLMSFFLGTCVGHAVPYRISLPFPMGLAFFSLSTGTHCGYE